MVGHAADALEDFQRAVRKRFVEAFGLLDGRDDGIFRASNKADWEVYLAVVSAQCTSSARH